MLGLPLRSSSSGLRLGARDGGRGWWLGRCQRLQPLAPVDWLSLLTHSPPPLLQVNGLAAQGKYEGSGEDGGAAAQSLYIANHAY